MQDSLWSGIEPTLRVLAAERKGPENDSSVKIHATSTNWRSAALPEPLDCSSEIALCILLLSHKDVEPPVVL